MPKLSKRIILIYAFCGAIIACLSIPLASITIYPGLHELLVSTSNILIFIAFMGLPGAVAGILIVRFSNSPWSRIAGFFGIILGVIWHLHLASLSAMIARASYHGAGTLTSVERLSGSAITRFLVNIESFALLHGGVFVGFVMLVLPIIMGMLGVSLVNFVEKRKGE